MYSPGMHPGSRCSGVERVINTTAQRSRAYRRGNARSKVETVTALFDSQGL